MNLLQLFGRLGADPETRFTSSGQKVTTFRMACNVRKGGQELTMWWRVTVWGDRFDKMMSYLKKGSAVIVVGSMQKPEIYTDRNGNPQVSLDITAESLHFSPFGGRSDQENQSTSKSTSGFGNVQEAGTHSGYSNTSEAEPTSAYVGGGDDMDDEPMPF